MAINIDSSTDNLFKNKDPLYWFFVVKIKDYILTILGSYKKWINVFFNST